MRRMPSTDVTGPSCSSPLRSQLAQWTNAAFECVNPNIFVSFWFLFAPKVPFFKWSICTRLEVEAVCLIFGHRQKGNVPIRNSQPQWASWTCLMPRIFETNGTKETPPRLCTENHPAPRNSRDARAARAPRAARNQGRHSAAAWDSTHLRPSQFWRSSEPC